MMVSKDGASAPTISSAFLSRKRRSRGSSPPRHKSPCRLASDCLMPSGVWPTSITVSGSCRITSRRPGQRASPRPDRTAASIAGASLAGPHPLQPEQEQRDRDGGIVELKAAAQARFERTKFDQLRTAKSNRCPDRRDGFSADIPISSRTNSDVTRAIAVIFDQMRPQAPAILAVDDRCRRPRRRRSCRRRSIPANCRAARHARSRPRSRRSRARRPGAPDRSGRRCRPRTPRNRNACS